MKKQFDPDICPLATRYGWQRPKQLVMRPLDKKPDTPKLKLVSSRVI